MSSFRRVKNNRKNFHKLFSSSNSEFMTSLQSQLQQQIIQVPQKRKTLEIKTLNKRKKKAKKELEKKNNNKLRKMKKKKQQKASKVKSKNLFMTCKFCVNAEKPKYLARATTSIYEIQDTQQEGDRAEGDRAELRATCRMAKWRNKSTWSARWEAEGDREGERGRREERGRGI